MKEVEKGVKSRSKLILHLDQWSILRLRNEGKHGKGCTRMLKIEERNEIKMICRD